MSGPLRLYSQPEMKSSALIVGWSVDVSKVGGRVTDYLIDRLKGRSFCEIEPAEFFALRGVVIEDDLVQFPESKFYVCPEKGLVIFKSTQPSYGWYKFLSLILDVAEQYCHVKELYTIGGTVSISAHTTPRFLGGTSNSPDIKDMLREYGLKCGLYYETPPDQRPTISAYLLWVAKRRNIPGANLWVPVPFYLATLEDLRSQKRALDFLNQRFTLGLEFSDLDEQIIRQNKLIAEVRSSSPEIDDAITKLESNLRLTEVESQKLLREVESKFRGKSPQPPTI